MDSDASPVNEKINQILNKDEEHNTSPEQDKKSSRLGNCEVCAVEPAKYTCPKCELKTCSLNCINIHKRELECDGVRNKVKFIPMQKFSNLELQNDFNLLEEVSNSLFKYKRDPVKNSISMYNKLPYNLHILRKCAYMRKTQLRFLPRLFTKHKMNTSYANKTKLFWRIEWVFVSANVKLTNEKLIDTTILNVALKSHLDKPELSYYKSKGVNGLLFLMKVERSSKFYLLDGSLSICENLKNKCILEFPIFYVIFNYEKDMFEIDHGENIRNTYYQNHNQDELDVKQNSANLTMEADTYFTENLDNKSMCTPSEDLSESIADASIKDDTEYHSICYQYDY